VILNPAVFALVGGSAVAGALTGAAAGLGAVVLRRWDLSSGSELQLALERRTYLVSTLLGFALAFQVLSLFLFVYTADAIAPQLTGAMCAAGAFKASAFGYPALLLKLLDAVLAGLWLTLNHADQQGYDYPLIRVKYRLLLGLAPLVLLEAGLQAAYFLDLKPAVITSCCGSLFAEGGSGFAGSLATLPLRGTSVALAVPLAGAVAASLWLWRTGRGAAVAGLLAAVTLPVALAAVVAVVSPYVYELPTHHCPFCLLQKEYHWLGYPLYATLLFGAVAGMGAGVLQPFRRVASLSAAVPVMQRRLGGVAWVLLLTFGALAVWKVAASGLRM
jgi:hypothetical protein